MRTYAPSPSISAPEIPLGQLGWKLPKRQMRQSVSAPKIPLHQLGWLGTASQAASKATSTALTATGAGAWAGPIGAGVGVVVGLIAGLMAAHALRAKQAKDENSAMNIGVQGFDADLKSVQTAFNSGQVDANTAIQAVQTLYQNYWNLVTPHIQPGRNGCSGGANCGTSRPSNYCSGSIGAACCVGCSDLNPSILGPNGVLAALQGQNGGVAQIQQVFGSKYGGSARGAYTLTFTPPPAAAASVSGTVDSLANSISQAISPSGSSASSFSLSTLLLIGAGLFLMTKL